MPPESLSTFVSRRSPRFAISSARSTAACRSRRGDPVEVREHAQVLLDRERDVEVVELRHDAHLRARRLGLVGQPVAEHLELALVGDRLRGQHLHRRRLAGAVGAEQADARALGHVEVEPVDGDDGPVGLAYPAETDDRTALHGTTGWRVRGAATVGLPALRSNRRVPSSTAMSARAWTCFAAVATLWGIPYLFIKVAVDDGVPPAFVAWSRVTLARRRSC